MSDDRVKNVAAEDNEVDGEKVSFVHDHLERLFTPKLVAMSSNIEAIEVRIFGDVFYEDLQNALANTVILAEESGIRKVLVDATKIESLPTIIEYFEIMSALELRLAYAIYSNPRCASAEILQFGETVAVNRGRSLRSFDDRHAATSWLLAQPFPRQPANIKLDTKALPASSH